MVKPHDGKIITNRPDVMWGTDQIGTMTGEGRACMFIAVDHCTTECMGTRAARRGTRFEALGPMRQSVRTAFGSYAQNVAVGLKVRHDHGSQFISCDYQKELEFLGIESSPAYVREPEGNGVAERLIRTLKEQLRWVRYFATSRAALGAPRVQRQVQPPIAARAPQLSHAGSSPRRLRR